jgi:hypothetical protein
MTSKPDSPSPATQIHSPIQIRSRRRFRTPTHAASHILPAGPVLITAQHYYANGVAEKVRPAAGVAGGGSGEFGGLRALWADGFCTSEAHAGGERWGRRLVPEGLVEGGWL